MLEVADHQLSQKLKHLGDEPIIFLYTYHFPASFESMHYAGQTLAI